MKKTQEHFVAYIELLDVKNRTENDFSCELLNKLNDCYELITNDLRHAMPVLGIEDCKLKIFADNIIVAIPSGSFRKNQIHTIIALNRIVTEVMLLQRKFIGENILARGGVSWGQLYIDDTIVWGPALNNAEYLVKTIAEYPRIVIDKNIPKFERHINNILVNFPSLHKIKRDFDDLFFFDYLNYPFDISTRTLIEQSLAHITNKINSEEDKYLLKNYSWHKNYLLQCKKEWGMKQNYLGQTKKNY